MSIGEVDKQSAKGILAAVIGQTIWGFSFIFSKMALQTATPSILLGARFLIAFLLMNLLLCTKKFTISLKGKNIATLLLLGLLEPVLYFYCESYGILYTNATFAGVMIALIPIIALILATIFLREHPTRKQKLFSALPIAGVTIIALSSKAEGNIRPIGIVIMTVCCFTAALSRVLSRKTAQDFSVFERTYMMMLLSCVVFTSAAVIENRNHLEALLLPFTSGKFLLSVFYLGALCSVGSYVCVNYALTKLSVARASVFASLTTVISIFAGVVFLGEPITWISVVASALIIFGIWKVSM